MMVLFQGVACNLCLVCVSCFIVFKSIKRWVHNVGCISCVAVLTRTGVNDFHSVMCIKGKYTCSLCLQITHILDCERARLLSVSSLIVIWASTLFVCDPVRCTLSGSQSVSMGNV